ncbi:MAG: T9SS type A sorting domain-containing protein [Bacteroidia bacterium]|nr:T9SS type A sorting domain-containing protein [Bacteroidia bacterium]MCF8427264.1 T9SS type A sorting domain-containing protein [Bacteroidia bacterium]MCF8445976.1 T9SS type A sorting domain-containing protein [Bacteroidia bacterium]
MNLLRTKFSFWLPLLFLLSFNSSVSFAQVVVPKKAGVCFRFDDFHQVADLEKVRALFNKHGLKFTYALNSSIGEVFGDSSYWNFLKTIQNEGHELADQSPTDVSHYFEPKENFEAMSYSGRPGIDHVNSALNKVCLKYTLLSTTGSGDEGKIDIKGNQIISKTAGEFAYSKLINLRYTTHFWIPGANKLVTFVDLRNANPNDVDTAYVKSFWKEDIDLGTYSNVDYKKITPYELTLDKEGLQAMAEFTLKIFARHNLSRPFSFIHPGGAHPYIDRAKLADVFSALGYSGGASYPSVRNGISYFNGKNDKQFCFQGGDFTPEYVPIADCKSAISERFAKNVVAISINHISSLGAVYPTDEMLASLESLLIWCKANNITVDTYQNWTNYLYNSYFDQTDDYFPPIQNDLNADNKPDGYSIQNLSLIDKVNGLPYNNNYCISVSSSGNIFSITELNGLNKGINTLKMSTKGGKNQYDYFSIVLDFPELNKTQQFFVYTSTANYTETAINFNVPEGVTYLNLSFNYNTDKAQRVYLSGIKLSSAKKPSFKATTFYRNAREAFQPITMANHAFCNGYPGSQLNFSVLNQPVNLTASLQGGKVLNLIPKANRFWVGQDSLRLRVIAPDNTVDTAWFYISSVAEKVCNGAIIDLTINRDSINDKSYQWSSLPIDASLVNASFPYAQARPTQNAVYTAKVTNKNNAVTSHAINLEVLPSRMYEGPYETKRFNGATSIDYVLNYPDYLKIYLGEFPQANSGISISGKTVTVTRDPSFVGNIENVVYVSSPTCEIIQHTLYATTYATGLTQMDAMDNLVFYPNPVQSKLTIKGLNPGKWEIEIYDYNGKLVMANLIQSEIDNSLDLEGLFPGIYLVKVSNPTQQIVKRILKAE